MPEYKKRRTWLSGLLKNCYNITSALKKFFAVFGLTLVVIATVAGINAGITTRVLQEEQQLRVKTGQPNIDNNISSIESYFILSPKEEFLSQSPKLTLSSLGDGFLNWINPFAYLLLVILTLASLLMGKPLAADQKDGEQLNILTQAIEQSPAPVIITDINGNIEYVNAQFTCITGYRFDEVIGQNPRILNSGKTNPEVYKKLWETITAGKKWKGVFQNKTKSGKLFWEKATISAIKNSAGTITHFLAIKEDITEQKSVEDKLQKTLRESEQLIDSLSAALIEIDKNDIITRWNPAAEKIFGIASNDAVGKPFLTCNIKWDILEILERIAECREAGAPERWEDVKFTRPKGDIGFLTITISPLISEGTAKTGTLILATDVTEQKSLKSQLAQSQKLESIGQLAAGIAHEINTPIQFVGDSIFFLNDGFNDLQELMSQYSRLLDAAKTAGQNTDLIDRIEDIADDIELDYLLESIPQAIDRSQKGIKRVTKIVRAMKEFSHPGTEEKVLTNINKALENTMTVAENEWKYIADITTHFEPSLPLVPCLQGELNQVFLNLLVNAAQAIEETLGKDSVEKGAITITTAHKNDWVEINISDNGSGIPEAAQSKIFDPFFTTKVVGKGTGQGLAISHSVIVDKHKGTITFDTKQGQGTTFKVRLPVNP